MVMSFMLIACEYIEKIVKYITNSRLELHGLQLDDEHVLSVRAMSFVL